MQPSLLQLGLHIKSLHPSHFPLRQTLLPSWRPSSLMQVAPLWVAVKTHRTMYRCHWRTQSRGCQPTHWVCCTSWWAFCRWVQYCQQWLWWLFFFKNPPLPRIWPHLVAWSRVHCKPAGISLLETLSPFPLFLLERKKAISWAAFFPWSCTGQKIPDVLVKVLVSGILQDVLPHYQNNVFVVGTFHLITAFLVLCRC